MEKIPFPWMPNGLWKLKKATNKVWSHFVQNGPSQQIQVKWNTPPKINIEPENDGLEDDFPFPGVYSQVPC